MAQESLMQTTTLNQLAELDRYNYWIFKAAALPWLINGRLLKRDYIPAGQANLANLLAPLLKLEHLIGLPCGLSLIAIAQK